jgi:hypothetical protein
MSLETLTAIPATIEQGGDYSLSLAYAELPVATWTSAALILARPGSGIPPVRFDATVSAGRYVFSLAHLVTATIDPGIWQTAVYLFDADNNRICAETGTIGVTDNLAVQQTPTIAQQMLAALDASILKLTTATGFQSVSFNGQSYTRGSLQMLREQRTALQAEVWREQQAQRRLRGTEQSGFVGVQFR